MTAPTTNSDVWAVLLPVLIGGALPIVGGLISPLLQHALSTTKSRSEKRLARFEALLQGIYDLEHWLENQRLMRLSDKQIEAGPSPIHRARSIVMIDFPELKEPIRKLDVAASSYMMWMMEAAMRRSLGEIDKVRDGFNEAYGAWLDAFRGFEEAAAEYYEKRKGKV